MKKFKVTFILTFIFLLLFSTAAYANWGISCVSDINTTVLSMYGDSHTAATEVVDQIYAYSWLYKNGQLVSTDEDLRYDTTWAQADVSCTNDIGDQYYEIDGYHWAKNYSGELLTGNSSNHMTY